jgi:hypothetical protein
MASSLHTNSHRISQLFERERDVENSVITNNPYRSLQAHIHTGHGGMDMPDNSNPKMKHALYFHRNKNQAPTSTRKSRQTEPVGGQTYNFLAGKKQRNSSFLNNFWREKKETTTTTTTTTECDWSEGPNDRTPSFVRNADASTYWGRRCTIGYKKYVIGQRARVSRGRVFWAVDLPRARKETKYVVS